jgi:hypothetical protein
MDPVEQVRVASDRIVCAAEKLNREGFEPAVLEVALIDAIVRFEKICFEPRASTADILRKLSAVVLDMAQAEEAQTSKEQH